MKKTFIITVLLFFLITLAVVMVQSCKTKSTKREQAIAKIISFRFKDKLSEYGFFKGSLKELQPANTIFKYELSSSLFTDYAVKERFIFLPAGTSIAFRENGILDFPDSTIIIKNFAYTNTAKQTIMIETRLLVKDPVDKQWKVMNYLWNAEQTDALKHITGAKLPITLLDDEGNKISTVYQVPNTNDCKRCHINNDTLLPIGPKARNLNFIISGRQENQLTNWTALGRLSGLPDLSKVNRLPDWKDSQHFNLNQRARAYLDINCAHCHIKGGDAYNTGLFLEYEQTDKKHLGIMKSPVSAGNGAGGFNYDIVAGDAPHSILAYRMNSTEPGTAMPELARTIIHQEGVKLIIDWINAMSTATQ
ncbi:MAG: SO2930 family diheme c-type cytochrome [Chitinophagaceae bacterium]